MSNSAAQFKVGDKVKVIDASGGGVLGEIKTIKEIQKDPLHYGWFYSFTEGAGLYEHRLELVQKEKKFAFEVGKKYLSEWNKTVHNCVYVHPSGLAVLEEGAFIFASVPGKHWKEVKEKVKATRYVHWFWNSDGSDFYTDTNGDLEPNLKYNKKRDYIKTDTVECEAEVR